MKLRVETKQMRDYRISGFQNKFVLTEKLVRFLWAKSYVLKINIELFFAA